MQKIIRLLGKSFSDMEKAKKVLLNHTVKPLIQSETWFAIDYRIIFFAFLFQMKV